MELSLDELKVQEPDWEKLEELYNKLEFNSLLSKIPEDKLSNKENSNYETKYKIVKNNEYNNIIKEIENSKSFGLNFCLKMNII